MKVDNITVGAMEKSSVLDLNYIIENVCIVIFILGREILQICKRKEKKSKYVVVLSSSIHQLCSLNLIIENSELKFFSWIKFFATIFF